ncbi:MAG: RluA family pseudouridine synthase [Clostridia bacterium]|nr:RluA family pseudouridine synthase [Clostridia bacterium]
MKEFSFTVDKEQKIIGFLRENGVSVEIVQKVKYGGVFLNGVVVKNINDLAKAGDEIVMKLPKDENNAHCKPIKEKLDVLYEDDYFLAVNKKKGVLTHSLRYNETPSLEQIVRGYFMPNDFTFRAVNRLDKETSGIVLIAKDEYSASLLGEKIKKGEILKTYLAVVKNKPSSNHFIVEKPILKMPNTIKRKCDNLGKHAKTEFFYVKQLASDKHLLKAILHTGRTHQIRVHLQSENLALLGDELYGEPSNEEYVLHAYKLEFVHPFTKEKIQIESPLKL